MSGDLHVSYLGTVGYLKAAALQERLRNLRIEEKIGDQLLLLQHPPVYTRGRRSTPDELPMAPDWYSERGVEIVDVRRGGKVTYHGPGQLVGYPIIRTGDVVETVRNLEQVMIGLAGSVGIQAHSRSDEGSAFTGVWVQERKLGAVGMHLSRGVTTHGFAINVVNDLGPFGWVVPCGLTATVTSTSRELGQPDLAAAPELDVEAQLAPFVGLAGSLLAQALGAQLVQADPADIWRVAQEPETASALG